MVGKTIAAGALLIVSLMSFEATAFEGNHVVTVNALGTLAQGEFRNNVKNGGGIDLGYAYSFGDASPVAFSIGANGMFSIYGHESYDERFSNSISRVKVNVETNNNIVLFGLTARFTVREGYVRPYIEGRTGLSYLYTDSKVTDYQTREAIASTKNFSNTTFNTAFGGGVLVPVYIHDGSRGGSIDRPVTVNVDVKFLYWHGGNAEYLPKGGILENDVTGDLVYDVRKSRTDMNSLHLGVVVEF